MLTDDGVHVEGNDRLQHLEGDREEDNRGQKNAKRDVRRRCAERFAERDPRGNPRQLGPIPDAGQAHVPARKRQHSHRGRHHLEARRVLEEAASDEADRGPGDAEIDLERLDAHAFLARGRDLGQERLVRPVRNGAEQEEELEHEEEVNGGHRLAAGRRHEDEEREDAPEGSAGEDVRDATTPG